MNTDIAKRWVEALRSGKYKQGTGGLKLTDDNGEKYCCLGVLCDLHRIDNLGYWEAHFPQNIQRYQPDGDSPHSGFLPISVAKWAGFDGTDPKVFRGPELDFDSSGTTLSWLNDNKYTFDRIADLIEMNFLNKEHKCR